MTGYYQSTYEMGCKVERAVPTKRYKRVDGKGLLFSVLHSSVFLVRILLQSSPSIFSSHPGRRPVQKSKADKSLSPKLGTVHIILCVCVLHLCLYEVGLSR